MTNYETAFELTSADGKECHVYIEAEYTPEQPAHVDEYGRATECATGEEWVIVLMQINGTEYDITDKTASLFDTIYDHKRGEWRPMTAADLNQLCIDYLIAERDTAGFETDFYYGF